MGWEAVQPVQAFLPEADARQKHQWLTESGKNVGSMIPQLFLAGNQRTGFIWGFPKIVVPQNG